MQKVDLDAGACLVLAFWHAHEPDLHYGVLTFSWKRLALTPVFDWCLGASVLLFFMRSSLLRMIYRYMKWRRSNQYDLDVTRLRCVLFFIFFVHSLTVSSSIATIAPEHARTCTRRFR